MHLRPIALLIAVLLALASPERPAAAAPPARRSALVRLSHRLRLPARYRLARMRFKRSWAGRQLKVASRRLKRATMAFRGRMTRTADRIELHLSPSLARGFHRVRGWSPFTVGAFALHKLKQDPVFFAGYGAFSYGLSNLQTPLLLAAGVSAPAAIAIRLATGTPVDLGVLLWREHRRLKRQDPSITVGGTLRHLHGEYGEFVVKRRAENRRYMARHHPSSSLRQLAGGL